MSDQIVFNRVEKKYIVSPEQKRQLLRAIKKNMEKDQYFESDIYNIYFDTPNFDLIIQSLDQPIFKEKLRARFYDGFDKVFLEIKTKLRGDEYNIGHKRRLVLSLEDYRQFVDGKSSLTNITSRRRCAPAEQQIAREIEYLVERFSLRPRILVNYHRESYIGEASLRVTFDSKLSYRNDKLDFCRCNIDKKYFSQQKNIIMEIKANGALPLWLVKTLSSEQVYPERFSKIGRVYQELINLTGKEKNV